MDQNKPAPNDALPTNTPQPHTPQLDKLYDAIIVGGGPAGLTAGIYLARARYRVLIVEKKQFGGQITITNEVVNYPGVERISGKALTDTMRRQAESFGAELMLAEVTRIESDGDIKIVHTTKGDFSTLSILLAIGSAPRKIGFPGEEKFQGHGVAYCATCDGEFFTGKDVFVVGGGFAAAEESVFLTKYAKHVHILIREDDFTCAAASTDAARANEKITIHTNTEVAELTGDTMPSKLVTKNNKTGELHTYEAAPNDTFGVFVLAGYAPETQLVRDIVNLDARGNIITNAQKQTSAEGIYAAGDVCVKDLRQVVTATGEAAIAATEMERTIVHQQKKTGLIPRRPSTRVNDMQQQHDTDATDTSAPKANALFDADMVEQLKGLCARMERSVILRLALDETSLSQELRAYCTELHKISSKIQVEVLPQEQANKEAYLPCVHVCNNQGQDSGLAFHGVPGGHEFTSFMLGLYNVAGPGQKLTDEQKRSIAALGATNVKILASLSCTMCPDTVVAAQHIAACNSSVSVDVYDIAHYPELKARYNVMSVPCIVVNDRDDVAFGRKDIDAMLELMRS